MANIKFYKAAAAPSGVAQGAIWFCTTDKTIQVYTGTAWEKYAGNLKDATWNSNKLTITKYDGSSLELDFSNVATTDQLSALQTTVANNKSAADIAIADAKEAGTDAAAALETYKTSNDAAVKALQDKDTEFADKITAVEGRVDTLETTTASQATAIENLQAAVGTGGSVDSKISEAIEALGGEATGEGAFVDVTVVTENGEVKSVSVTESDIASAAALADEVTARDALEGEFDAHVADKVVHITADERAAWNGAKEDIDAFMNSEAIEGAVDTLKEIQKYITDDAAAADALVKRVGTNETAIFELQAIDHDAYKAADTELETSLKAYADQAEADALTAAKADATEKAAAAKAAAETTAASDATTKANAAEANAIAAAKEYADGLAGNYDAKGTAQGLIDGLDATVKDEADYVTGQVVQENGKLSSVSFAAKVGTVASGDDALALASDVKTYVDSTWTWAEFE